MLYILQVLLSDLVVGAEYSVVVQVNGSYGEGPASVPANGTAPEGGKMAGVGGGGEVRWPGWGGGGKMAGVGEGR